MKTSRDLHDGLELHSEALLEERVRVPAAAAEAIIGLSSSGAYSPPPMKLSYALGVAEGGWERARMYFVGALSLVDGLTPSMGRWDT